MVQVVGNALKEEMDLVLSMVIGLLQQLMDVLEQ
jgi:hypothetical protein